MNQQPWPPPGVKWYYADQWTCIAHGDCREILPLLPKVDLVLTDPPYGIRLDTDNSRFSGGNISSIKRRGNGSGTGMKLPVTGDNKPFDPRFLLGHGKYQVIWGWNHFPDLLPRGGCLVWIKRYEEAFGTFLSDAELAWMSKGHGVYCKRDLSNNGITLKRVHPTQKPVDLMQWCLSFFPDTGTVLDPYAGSGTSLVACKASSIRSIGVECEECWCEAAARRLAQEVLPFNSPPIQPQPEQMTLVP